MNDNISPTSFQKTYLFINLFAGNHLSSFTSGDMECCTPHVSSGSSLNFHQAELGAIDLQRVPLVRKEEFLKNKFATLNSS